LARGKDPFHSVLAPSTVLTNHLLVKLLRQCPVCEELCDLLCRRPVLTAVLAPWPRALAPVSKRNPLSHSLSFSVFLLSLSLSLSLLPSLAFSHSIPAKRGLAELLVSRSWRFLAKRKRTYRLPLTVFDTVWRGNVLTSYCVCAQFDTVRHFLSYCVKLNTPLNPIHLQPSSHLAESWTSSNSRDVPLHMQAHDAYVCA